MRLDHLLSKEDEVGIVLLFSCQKTIKYFWCRCAFGKHPFSFRTRWLRLKRPMILYWRRYGKAGGCQNYGGIAQLGERLPCKQEVTSSNLVISTKLFWKRIRWTGTDVKLAWNECYRTADTFAKCTWARKSWFSSAHGFQKCWVNHDKNMYLENCILKMIRHQTVNNQISYL